MLSDRGRSRSQSQHPGDARRSARQGGGGPRVAPQRMRFGARNPRRCHRDHGLGVPGLGVASFPHGFGPLHGGVDLRRRHGASSPTGRPSDNSAGAHGGSDIVIATTGAQGLITPAMVRPRQAILPSRNPTRRSGRSRPLGRSDLRCGWTLGEQRARLSRPLRGALDAGARCINNRMKIAAAEAIANEAEQGDLVPTSSRRASTSGRGGGRADGPRAARTSTRRTERGRPQGAAGSIRRLGRGCERAGRPAPEEESAEMYSTRPYRTPPGGFGLPGRRPTDSRGSRRRVRHLRAAVLPRGRRATGSHAAHPERCGRPTSGKSCSAKVTNTTART